MKSSIPPFYQFSECLKPTLSKAWITNYEQSHLLAQLFEDLAGLGQVCRRMYDEDTVFIQSQCPPLIIQYTSPQK